jgi:aqualysin 1
MKRTILLLTLTGAMLLACTGVVLAQQTPSGTDNKSNPPKTPKNKIPGSYIVVLKNNEDPDQVAQKKERELGGKVKHIYKHALNGFSIEISDDQVEELRANPEVAYVEQDQVVQAVAQTLPWGMGDNGIVANQSSTKVGDGTGTISNVNAYVIDTGIDTSHPDLNVVNHVNPSGAAGGNKDCNGHGTHVAGTVAAKDNTADVVGVAPGAPLTGVKVLNCSGAGSWSGVIKGIDWVTANAKKPAVANMSLGGGASKAVDDAVIRSASSGVFYAVAAGNNGADACTNSPARAGTNNGVMTVAATDVNDKEASWSNYGKCVDIWAPGVSILSTRKGGGTTTMSGTSMASPHGAGGGALYLSSHTTDTPSDVESAIKSARNSPGTSSKNGDPILLEYVGGY